MKQEKTSGSRGGGLRPCVLIPAYNEERYIADVVRGALSHVEKVIVVDDGSRDATAGQAAAAGAEVIRHASNRGKGAGLKTGLERAFAEGFDPVIVLDGDGQHDTAEIPAFLEAARSGDAAIIVGNRMGNPEGMPFVRRCTNRLTSFFVSRLAGQRIPDSQNGFRLIRKRAFEQFRFGTSRYDTEPEMLIEAGRAGMKIDWVPVRTIYGTERSTVNPVTDTMRFIRLVVRYLWRE